MSVQGEVDVASGERAGAECDGRKKPTEGADLLQLGSRTRKRMPSRLPTQGKRKKEWRGGNAWEKGGWILFAHLAEKGKKIILKTNLRKGKAS